MHAGHSTLEIIAHLMIAFLFIFRAIDAFPQFDSHARRFEARRIPFPRPFLACGFATMLIGGVSVAVDFHAGIGAAMLIVFTVLANLLYHDFWAMEAGPQRNNHRNIFCNNIAVMGGLVMVAAA